MNGILLLKHSGDRIPIPSMTTLTTGMKYLTRLKTGMKHLTRRKMDACGVKAKLTTFTDEVHFWERKCAFQG